jgi:DNA-binding winged helix-turn-helix (wHTH) protein
MDATQSRKYCYCGLTFDPSLVFALDTQQNKIKFSKHERALLCFFMDHPQKLVSRESILDCLHSAGDLSYDRNVDYLVSRLRHKLGDSVKTPQFIATQYGEGYIWIAKVNEQPAYSPSQIYLSVGPIYGLNKMGPHVAISNQVIEKLLIALRANFSEEHKIVLNNNATVNDPAEILNHHSAKYTLELSFLAVGLSIKCSLMVLNRKSGQVIDTQQISFQMQDYEESIDKEIAIIGKRIKTSIWDTQIFRPKDHRAAGENPLVIGLHEAAILFDPNVENFDLVEEKIRERQASDPTNAYLGILLASCMHSRKYLSQSQGIEEREMLIEELVLRHVKGVQDNALYLSASAEMLYELGYLQLGEELANRAFDMSSSLAACCMVVGRIKVLQGHIREGISYYDHCLEMIEHNGHFHLMLLTRKAIAYKVLGDQQQVRDLVKYITKHGTREWTLNDITKKIGLDILLLAGDKETFGFKKTALASLVPKSAAIELMLFTHYLTTRFFANESHRINILRGPIELFTKIHGADFLPEIIKETVPSLNIGS